VVFSGDSRKQGYRLKTAVEEQKVRSFLKLFHFAQLYLLVFGALLSQICASWLIEASFDRPARHVLGAIGMFLAVYTLVVGLPYFFLWRTYKHAVASFTDTADAVSLVGASAPRRSWVLIAVCGFALLLLAAVLILTMSPAPR
jgi:hypothetical protein